jgi:hypothetical protein
MGIDHGESRKSPLSLMVAHETPKTRSISECWLARPRTVLGFRKRSGVCTRAKRGPRLRPCPRPRVRRSADWCRRTLDLTFRCISRMGIPGGRKPVRIPTALSRNIYRKGQRFALVWYIKEEWAIRLIFLIHAIFRIKEIKRYFYGANCLRSRDPSAWIASTAWDRHVFRY